MFPQWLRYVIVATVAMSFSGVRALGSSPAEDRLLRLVPAHAALVAGIEDPHHGDESGRLLIVTHNNNVDLQDWITLAGVDDQREVDRLIEVATSSPQGDLSEHLLLVRGSFNGRRILRAAEDDGGVPTSYAGVRVAILKPFAREQKEMPDMRWLAILNDNTAIFGTPTIVKSALDRYASSSAADGSLVMQLQKLKSDVNCWSVLAMPGAVLSRHLLPGVVDPGQTTLLRKVRNIAIGIHYGSKARMDFAVGMDDAAAASALATAMGNQSHLLTVADTLRTRFENVSVQQNEVRGSVQVAGNKFETWLAAVHTRLLIADRPGGENVAQAVAAH